MPVKGSSGSAPPLASTLPPKRASKAKARKVDDGIPKGSLPKPKKRVAKAKAPTRAKSAPVVDPPWDADREAFLAKQAVLERAKSKLIEAPEGAVVVPGVSKRARKRKETVEAKLEPMPHGGALKRAKAPPPAPPVKRERVEKRVMIPMTDDLWKLILSEIAEGVSLREICRRPDMPSKSEFYRYKDGEDLDPEDPAAPDIRSGRLARYARARRDGYDALAEEILEIADDGTNDWVLREREDGSEDEVIDRDHIARSKLRVESRFKLLAVWDPKRYGNMLKLGDPDARPLEQGGKSANDLAIGIAKLIVAARAEKGQPLDADVS